MKCSSVPRFSVSPTTRSGETSTPFAHFDQTIDDLAAVELDQMLLPIAANRQAQPFRQRIDAGDANAVQTTRNLVRILVELAARVQHAHDDLRRRTLRLVLVVELDAGRYAAPVVGHRNRIVGMNGDHDVVAMTGQRLVDGVIDDLEDHVVQTRAVRGVTDVHPGALADRLQASSC
jgi:hypothetical protein